jgi:hypothetical protein
VEIVNQKPEGDEGIYVEQINHAKVVPLCASVSSVVKNVFLTTVDERGLAARFARIRSNRIE